MSEILLLSNPSKRRKHSRKRKSARRRGRRVTARRSKGRIRVSARRNPVSVRGLTSSLMPTVKGGFFGAVGGLGNDLLYGYGKQYLPAVMQSGIGRSLTKIGSAVLVGVAGNMVLRGKGSALAVGAATCAIHEALKEQLSTAMPSLPLGEMDEPLSDYMQNDSLGWSDSAQPVGEYVSGFGAYVGGDD